jgi:hypothetical protein
MTISASWFLRNRCEFLQTAANSLHGLIWLRAIAFVIASDKRDYRNLSPKSGHSPGANAMSA